MRPAFVPRGILMLALLGFATLAAQNPAPGAGRPNPGAGAPSSASPGTNSPGAVGGRGGSGAPPSYNVAPAPPPAPTPAELAANQTALKKQLQQEADQLVALAQQLKQSIDQNDPAVLSLDIVNRADDIDKLARKIRDSMKTGSH